MDFFALMYFCVITKQTNLLLWKLVFQLAEKRANVFSDIRTLLVDVHLDLASACADKATNNNDVSFRPSILRH